MNTEYGCWFCKGQDNLDDFTFEFDCEVHYACLDRERAAGNPEAEIIHRELEPGRRGFNIGWGV